MFPAWTVMHTPADWAGASGGGGMRTNGSRVRTPGTSVRRLTLVSESATESSVFAFRRMHSDRPPPPLEAHPTQAFLLNLEALGNQHHEADTEADIETNMEHLHRA